jgi:hypothetical protein
MHNYTLLNGQNFSISNNSGNHYFSLNISGASHVSVEFLKIDTAYQPGIFVNLSSNDTFSHLNVSSALVSLFSWGAYRSSQIREQQIFVKYIEDRPDF